MGTVGAARFSPELNQSRLLSLHKDMTIFSAECIAIKTALELASNCSQHYVYIYSDCLSALIALSIYSGNAKSNPFLLDIHNLINSHIMKSKKLLLFWIPSHIGITFNEKVDALAKKASLMAISVNNILVEAKYKGIKFFRTFYHFGSRSWFAHLSLPRDFMCWVNRLRSGHYQLNASLFKINLAADTSCLCGCLVQDPNHVIWQCPLYDNNRDALIHKLCNKGFFPPYSIDVFLYGPSLCPLLYIHKFLMAHCLQL